MNKMRLLLCVSSVAVLGVVSCWYLRQPAADPNASHSPVMEEIPPVQVAPPNTAVPQGEPEPDSPRPDLPPSRDVTWRTPSAIAPMAAFQEWSTDYIASPDAAKVAEGAKLAARRRESLRALIRQDPELALANAVPEAVRRSLPAEVRVLLEEKIDARGDFIVTGMTAAETRVPAGRRGVRTRVVLDNGARFDAFTYGRREYRPSRRDLPVHGIAVDGRLAVGELPGRVLEPVEVADALAAAGSEPVCPTSGNPVSETGTATALLIGREVEFFCGPGHAARVLSDAADSESPRPPGLGVRFTPPVDAASGGAGVAVPSPLSEGDPAWTTGAKRILAVRVEFAASGNTYVDYTGLTVPSCAQIVDGIGAAYNDWSYGRLKVLPVQSGGSKVTAFVKLNRRAVEYAGDEIGDIWDEVRSKVKSQEGVNPDSYDYILVLAGNAPITDEDDDSKTVWWGGLGRIGEGLSFIRVNDPSWTVQERIDRNVGVSLHEIGHNLGLFHSSNIFTSPQISGGVVSVGEEYGDRYDRMGRGGTGSDFNVRYKQWLNWLDNASVPYAGTDGVYKIREHDLEEESGIRGLQTSPEPIFLPFGSASQIFIEYRLHGVAPEANVPYIPYNNTIRAYAAQIRLGKPNSPKTWLLDTTPETPNWEPVPSGSTEPDTSGNLDSPLMPGRTWSFTRNGSTVYVTNLGADPDAGELKVDIQHGPVAGNDPPTGSIAVNTPQGAKNQNVLFTASATDPEDSDLAYHWQLPGFDYDAFHPAVFPNAKSIIVKFPNTGVWTVKCLVSDKHGGTVQLTRSFSVVANQPPVISAIADKITDEDTPLLNIPFTVSDPTTPAGSLTVSAATNNATLFPAGSIVLGGSGGSRTVSLMPAANRHGTAEITLQVSDGALQDVEKFKVTVNPVTPGTTLIAAGGSWRYWDQAGAPSGDWRSASYNDSSWGLGNARFVYPAPVLNFGGWTVLSTQLSRPACYFRRSFSMPAAPVGTPVMRFLCDDGLVVHVNGVEVWRYNMPDGPVSHSTRALASVGGEKLGEWITVPLGPGSFQPGAVNTVAVEVHDSGGTRGGGDVTFDFSLALLQTPTVSRLSDRSSPEDQLAGPYGFSASEAESPSGGVTFAGSSSNQALVLDSSIKFGFNIQTFQWTVSCTPQPNATGTSLITVKVSDGSSETWETFKLTVLPVNDPPLVQPVPDLAVPLDGIVPLVEVQVADVDNDPATLTVTATSSNGAVLPTSGIEVLPGPSPDRRWLRLSPNAGIAAQSNVTVNVSDGLLGSSDVFVFRVSLPLGATATNASVVRSGEYWRYWASALPVDGHGQPVDFTDPALDDRAWPSGPSQLGYGNDGEATVVPATPYRVTTYFRKKFTIPKAAAVSALNLRMIRDDGAVVYLNGNAVWSSNMPRTVITASTLASSDISGAAEDAWQSTTIDTSHLVSGTNTLAVELHQSVLPSGLSPGDLSFDLEVDGVPTPVEQDDVLIPPGAVWSYWDQAAYPDDTWRLSTYVEEGWKQGLARLGYGIGGESTIVNKDNAAGTGRNPSVLFRRTFEIADPAAYATLHLYAERDDGIAIFLNGTRVFTENVAALSTPGDFALSEIPSPQHTQWRHYFLDPRRLISGRNLIAVEIHQSSISGTDLNFDLELLGEVTGQPRLFVRPVAGSIELSWAAAYDGWSLRHSGSLAGWLPVSQPQWLDGAWIYVLHPNPGPFHYYRLQRP